MQTGTNGPVLVRRCMARGGAARREVGRAAGPGGPAADAAGARTPLLRSPRGANRGPRPSPAEARAAVPAEAPGRRVRTAEAEEVGAGGRRGEQWSVLPAPRPESPGPGAHLSPASERLFQETPRPPRGPSAAPGPGRLSHGRRGGQLRAPGPLPAAASGPLRQRARPPPGRAAADTRAGEPARGRGGPGGGGGGDAEGGAERRGRPPRARRGSALSVRAVVALKRAFVVAWGAGCGAGTPQYS